MIDLKKRNNPTNMYTKRRKTEAIYENQFRCLTYKIISSCIITRIKMVLPNIIHHCQKAFIKGRYKRENIRLTYEEYIENPNWSLSSRQFWKSILQCVLDIYYEESSLFPDNIIRWFYTLYNNATFCVTFNGQYSRWF